MIRRTLRAGPGANDLEGESSRAQPEGGRAELSSSILDAHRSRRGRSASGGDGQGSRGKGLLTDEELVAIEEAHEEGITAGQVVEIFSTRGLRFSEATFRKYVQQGLLRRSRRIGRKGKHRGSMGVYPPTTVRRINAIKRLMGEGYTIEEIQEQFLRFADILETLEEGLTDIFERLEREAQSPRFESKARRSLKREIREARRTADELMRRISGLSERVSRPREDQYGSTGAAGSAEELL